MYFSQEIIWRLYLINLSVKSGILYIILNTYFHTVLHFQFMKITMKYKKDNFIGK